MLFIVLLYIFLVFVFFTLLNIFDVKYIKNLSDFKKLGIIFPVNLVFLITILSFAGIPPLFGFSIKLILFLSLIKSGSLFYLTLLTVFNFFTLYFYIQNTRYVISNSQTNFYIYINNFVYLSEVVLFILLFSLLLNVSGIVYLSDLFILCNGVLVS